MKGCAKFGLYAFGVLFALGLVSSMCQGIGRMFGAVPSLQTGRSATATQRVQPTPPPTPTSRPTPVPEVKLPIVVKSRDGWQFSISEVRILEAVETNSERMRPVNSAFAVLVGQLTNYTDKSGCIHGRDFHLTSGSAFKAPLEERVLGPIKAMLNGMDYPGSFTGQCLDYDKSAPSFLVFDGPVNTVVSLDINGTTVPIGVISQLAELSAMAAQPKIPTEVPTPTSTPLPLAVQSSTAESAMPMPAAETAKLHPVDVALSVQAPTSTLEAVPLPAATDTPLPTSTPEPTSTEVPPTPTSSPTPAPITGVSNRDANLRSGPGTDYEILGNIPASTQLEILGTNELGDWYQLSTKEWIAAFLVDGVLVPVPTLPPTPTPLPSPTPRPTPTLPPQAPSCQEVKQIFAGATSAQWDTYSQNVVRGTWITNWTGYVSNVEGWSMLLWGYPMHIEIEPDCDIYYVIKDDQEALRYSVGDQVTITARVAFIGEFWDSFTFHVDEETARIR